MLRRQKKKVLLLLAVSLAVVVIRFLSNRITRRVKHETANLKGFNVAIWEDLCGYDMRSLKEFPLFPHAPAVRLKTRRLQMHFTRGFENFGLRIYGFLSPKESGSYNFNLATSGTSELWISLDSNPENSKLIANVTSGITWKYERNAIPLSAGKRYYMEILLKNGRRLGWGLDFMHLKWRSSKWKEDELRDIPSNVLIEFEDDQNSNLVGEIKSHSLLSEQEVSENNILPMHIQHRDPSFVNEQVKRRTEIYHLPFIREEDTLDLFPPCQYNPSYIVKKPLERYQSMWETHYTAIYPYDYSEIVGSRYMYGSEDFISLGNNQMDENTAKKIVSQVWTQIESKHPG